MKDGTSIRVHDPATGKHIKMGEIKPNAGLFIVKRSHGKTHTAAVSVAEVLTRLSGTHDRDAVANWARSMLQ